MSGAISRMSRIVRAEVEEVLSRFEDPSKVLSQMVIDMERALDSAVAETSRAVANHRLMERRLASVRDLSSDLERKAEAAVRAGQDDEARALLDAKFAADQTIERQAQAVEEAGSVAEDLKKRLTSLREKLKEAKARGPALVARRARVSRSRSDESGPRTIDTEPFRAYDRLVDDVERKEIAAEVYEEIVDAAPRDDYERLARQRRVEEELTALREKTKQG